MAIGITCDESHGHVAGPLSPVQVEEPVILKRLPSPVISCWLCPQQAGGLPEPLVFLYVAFSK